MVLLAVVVVLAEAAAPAVRVAMVAAAATAGGCTAAAAAAAAVGASAAAAVGLLAAASRAAGPVDAMLRSTRGSPAGRVVRRLWPRARPPASRVGAAATGERAGMEVLLAVMGSPRMHLTIAADASRAPVRACGRGDG